MLTSLIDPKILLTIVKNEIEKQLKTKVYNYVIIYRIKPEKLMFIVKDKIYNYDNKSVVNTIRKLIEKKVKIDNELKAFKIEYNLNEKVTVSLTIYSNQDNTKQIDKYEL